MTNDKIEFTTDRGAEVIVTADNGTIRVDVESPAVNLDTTARLEEHKGMTVLNCGIHRINGSRERIQIPAGDHVDAIEQLKEDSIPEQTGEPVVYEVEEYSKGTGSWGQEIMATRLVANKSHAEMTDRQRELHAKVNTDRAPSDAEAGDELRFADLLADVRTTDEKDQDALEEAAETGEEVVIKKSTTDCDDPSKECNLDHVTRVATPEGEIETRRTHTY